MVIVKIEDWNGQPAGLLTAKPKEFSTGSKGYFGTGKVELGGKRYQVQINLVEIGSKARANGNGAQTEPEVRESA